jgi:hypothetical protein
MLLTYVHAYVTGIKNQLHMQATGPAFPTGYASGNITTNEAAYAEIARKQVRGSLRPKSGSKYALLSIEDSTVYTAEDICVCSVSDLVEALQAPLPAYSESKAAEVSAHVKARVAEPINECNNDDEALNECEEECAALRTENENLRAQVRNYERKFELVRSAL